MHVVALSFLVKKTGTFQILKIETGLDLQMFSAEFLCL